MCTYIYIYIRKYVYIYIGSDLRVGIQWTKSPLMAAENHAKNPRNATTMHHKLSCVISSSCTFYNDKMSNHPRGWFFSSSWGSHLLNCSSRHGNTVLRGLRGALNKALRHVENVFIQGFYFTHPMFVFIEQAC